MNAWLSRVCRPTDLYTINSFVFLFSSQSSSTCRAIILPARILPRRRRRRGHRSHRPAAPPRSVETASKAPPPRACSCRRPAADVHSNRNGGGDRDARRSDEEVARPDGKEKRVHSGASCSCLHLPREYFVDGTLKTGKPKRRRLRRPDTSIHRSISRGDGSSARCVACG